MEQSKLADLLQALSHIDYGSEPVFIVAITVFSLLVLLYLWRKNAQLEREGDDEPVAAPQSPQPAAPVAQPAAAAPAVEAAPAPAAAATPAPPPPRPAPAPVAAAAVSSVPAIPQDSALRRHYLRHIVYMLETTTFPRPSENSLRRHYDGMIASELEACISDPAHLARLIERYDAQRRQGG
jgi:type IV secretory pathway VirB10-like protein